MMKCLKKYKVAKESDSLALGLGSLFYLTATERLTEFSSDT